ncbi:MAG: hypothetical protein IKS42_09945 [Oscillospiraceae bacterium]|nr:hypothetical protein [Oscillospiraceae bacterium]
MEQQAMNPSLSRRLMRYLGLPLICILLFAIAVLIFWTGLKPLRERIRYSSSEHFTVRAELQSSVRKTRRSGASETYYENEWQYKIGGEPFTYKTQTKTKPQGKTLTLHIYSDSDHRYHAWEPKSLMTCIVRALMMTCIALLAVGTAFASAKVIRRMTEPDLQERSSE